MALVSWGMRERWVAVSGRSQCLIRPALNTLRPLQILHAPNAQPPPVLYSRPSDNSPGSPAALCSESSADELEPCGDPVSEGGCDGRLPLSDQKAQNVCALQVSCASGVAGGLGKSVGSGKRRGGGIVSTSTRRGCGTVSCIGSEGEERERERRGLFGDCS
ncbi:unnamed protein product [Lampetra fluviatilis]